MRDNTLHDARVIVVYANDKGMADTLQDAVNVCLPNQYIYIMEETHKTEMVHIPFDCEGCIIEQGNVRITGNTVSTNIVVNGGTVQFKSIHIHPLVYKQAIEINGGNVSFIDVEIFGYTNTSKKQCDNTVGIYVNNDANVMMKNCSLRGLYVGIYARGGKVYINDSSIGSFGGGYNSNGIVLVGKDSKAEVDIEDCVFRCDKRAISSGGNSEVRLYRCNKEPNYGDICSHGGGYEDSSAGTISIYDSTFFYIKSYDKGIINLHNSKVDEIEAVNAAVICYECEPRAGIIRLRKNENGTIICNSKCSETTNVLHWGRMDYIVRELEWIIQWSLYPLAESVKYVVESYERDRDKLNTKMKHQADMLMKQLRKAVVSDDTNNVRKVEAELLNILFAL